MLRGPWMTWLVVLTFLGGCWHTRETVQFETGGEDDATEAPADETGDDDTDPASSSSDQGGDFLDPETGLVWQDPPLWDLLIWMQANDYCNQLEHGGYDDWRLPDVDELQGLIRGCPGAADCGVDDPECLEAECDEGLECVGCEDWEGPAADGCYWVSSLDGWCEIYWSSSPAGIDRYWTVDYIQAKTRHDDLGFANAVRCIREP